MTQDVVGLSLSMLVGILLSVLFNFIDRHSLQKYIRSMLV